MTANAKPFLLYDNRLEDGTPTATDTETGYDVLNLIDWREYTFWQADTFGTKYITIDCGAPVSADTLAVSGNNFYTASATISLESSADNATWTERLVGFTVTSDDVFAKTFTSASARYWRLKIITAAVAARMAILCIGIRLDMERYPQMMFDPDQQSPIVDSERSKVGYLLGNVINYHERQISASFKNLTPAWISSTFYPAWVDHLSLLKPFFFAWDITNHATEVYLVALKSGSKLSMPNTTYFRSVDLNMIGSRE